MQKRLGRGLKALLGEEAERIFSGALREIPVEKVKPSPFQPRLDKGSIEELSESIKKHGVLQPIIVTETDDGYEVIAGERRLLAAKAAGLKTIPAIVGSWESREKALIALVENIQRKNLSPIEEALFYKRLSEEFGLTQEEIAKLIGKSRSHIANVMRMCALPDEAADALLEGKISLGHAKALLSLKDKELILEALKVVLEKNLTVRETERLVAEMKDRRPKDEIAIPGLEARVRVKKLKGNRVRLTIECSDKDLPRLLERLKLDL